MILNKKTRHLIISFGIISFWVIFNFLFFYPATNGMGRAFNLAIMYILTRNFALYGGLAVLLLRLLTVIKSNTNVLYIFMGTLNLIVGIFCIILYYLSLADLPWLHDCLLNLLIGFVILTDTFIIFKTPANIS